MRNQAKRRRTVTKRLADPDLAALGSRLKAFRHVEGISQEEAAHRGGISLRTLQNLEKGRVNPSYLTLKRLGRGFGRSIVDLVDD